MSPRHSIKDLQRHRVTALLHQGDPAFVSSTKSSCWRFNLGMALSATYGAAGITGARSAGRVEASSGLLFFLAVLSLFCGARAIIASFGLESDTPDRNE